MQTIGLADSTPKQESRWKALFWPRVRYAEDIELLKSQGFWVCIILSAYLLATGIVQGQRVTFYADVLYYFLAATGIRRKSRFAASSAFVIYSLSVITSIKVAHQAGVGTIFFLALLFSNLRATWMAKRLSESERFQIVEPFPEGSLATFSEIVSRAIWPIGRWVYYILTVLMLVGIVRLLSR